MPGLCVIIPAFKPTPAQLAGAIDSALVCERLARVIVIDDGSPLPISLEPRHATDQRVSLTRQSNAGPSAARNRGLDLAQKLDPDHVVFLDHDDRLVPAGVAALIALADRFSAAAGVGARIEVSPDGTRTLKPVPPEWANRTLPSPDLVFVPKQLFAAPGTLITRRGLAPNLRFDESLVVVEDREYLRRVADHGPVAISAEPVVEYSVGVGGSLSSPAHVAKRIRGHLAILERHWTPQADGPLREATIWLINFAAKAAHHARHQSTPLDPDLWHELLAAARARGWSIPLKARWRWWRSQR